MLAKPAHSADSDDWQLFTNYTLKPGGAGHGSVYVVAQGVDVGPLTGVGSQSGPLGSQSSKSPSDCETAGRIVYCVTTTYTGTASSSGLPTDTQVLGGITLFGSDQSSWSPDLVVQ